MTVPKSTRQPINRKSVVLQALFMVVLLLIARLMWLRNQPERLTAPPGGLISGENRYDYDTSQMSLVPRPKGVSTTSVGLSGNARVEARHLHDERKWTVTDEDAHYRFSGFPNMFSVFDGKFYYAVEPRPKSEMPLGGGGGASAPNLGTGVVVSAPSLAGGGFGSAQKNPDQFLGIFLRSPKRLPRQEAVGQKRVRLSAASSPGKEVLFRQVATQGGKPRDVLTLRTDSFRLIGNHVIWIKPGLEEIDTVTQKQGSRILNDWQEVTAESDLMLTSLADGTTRCIRHGISRDLFLFVGETGVAWTEPAPFPQQPTLFYGRVSDGVVCPLGTLPKLDENDENRVVDPRHFVETGDRLYWTMNHHGERGCVLMSARPDGSDLREVCSQRNKHPIIDLALHAYMGKMYGCLTEAAMTSNGLVVSSYLCRVHPERSDPLEVLNKLPLTSQEFQFDAGYLYFFCKEKRWNLSTILRNLWAIVTSDNVGAEYTNTLYRLSVDR